MTLRFATLPVAALALAVFTGPVRAEPDDPKVLAAKARDILKVHCQRCHKGPGSDAEFDVFSIASMTGKRGDGENPYLVVGDPDKSYLFERIAKGTMPPRKIEARPTDEEKEILKQWIKAGLPEFPVAEARARKPVSDEMMMGAIRDHLRKLDRRDAKYIRYFTLNHLHNNPAIPDGDLAGYRASLSKALNSLSWKNRVVLPEAVDEAATVLCIDIRDLDWDRGNLWRYVMQANRYGLSYAFHKNKNLQKIDEDICERTDCDRPYVRADWFVATATRPPLYHQMVQLPEYAYELERRLDVDVFANFTRNRLWRAGFAKSGVSEQNRMVERHEAKFGSYWKSYDFKKASKQAVLTQFPLGPTFEQFRGLKHPYANQAFRHDGGEIIFNLPNGLQGYMLIDGKDKRIDSGPIEVVSDNAKTSGTPEIVNGLSCMFCHKNGTIKFKGDTIREGTGVQGPALRKVEDLYVDHKKMEGMLDEDEDRFVRALDKAIRPYFKGTDYEKKKIQELPEPVGQIAALHQRPLDIMMAAYELGLEDPKLLAGMIAGNKRLQEMGLAPLLKKDGVILRHDWEETGRTSVFQRAAQELRYGTPMEVLK